MNVARGLRVRPLASLLSTALWMILAGLSAKAQTFTVVHSFGATNDGAYPLGPLLHDFQGNVYGASQGGGLGWGTVFEITASGQERVLYSFQDGTDGLLPFLSFVESGSIVGTTYQGGVNEFGTVFELDSQGKLTILYSCCSTPAATGTFPGGVIPDSNRALYGVNLAGGNGACVPTGCGTMFNLNSDGVATVIHTFGGVAGDGEFPNRSLVSDPAGNLYGTTTYGGAYGFGTVFKMSTGGSEAVLYSFQGGADGANPTDGVYRDPQGNLYGTTASGGSDNFGTVFKVTSSGEHLVLYSFNGLDGAQPIGGVAFDANGNLYGATYLGGRDNKGTIFKLDTNGDLTVLHEFSGIHDGEYPESVLPMNDALYGVTYQGGAYNLGVVFKLIP